MRALPVPRAYQNARAVANSLRSTLPPHPELEPFSRLGVYHRAPVLGGTW